MYACVCGSCGGVNVTQATKQRSQNPPHNLEPGLEFGQHGTEQLSTRSTSCPVPWGGDWLGFVLPMQRTAVFYRTSALMGLFCDRTICAEPKEASGRRFPGALDQTPAQV